MAIKKTYRWASIHSEVARQLHPEVPWRNSRFPLHLTTQTLDNPETQQPHNLTTPKLDDPTTQQPQNLMTP